MKHPRIWFQLVFTYLTAQFVIGGLTYLVSPETAQAGMRDIARQLAVPDSADELVRESVIWRTLAGTNVLALGFMCLLLQVNVRRFYPVLYPLVFMKAATALAFAIEGALKRQPVLLAIGAYDGFNVALMSIFAPAARRSYTP